MARIFNIARQNDLLNRPEQPGEVMRKMQGTTHTVK